MTRSSPRRGATAVETAVVLLPFLAFTFGIYEYGRFLMDWNVLNNAARTGCRYAVVNNTSSTISTDVTSQVTTAMVGRQVNFTGFTVSVSGTHNGVSTTDVTTLVPGDFISVTVSGSYQLLDLIPMFNLPTSIPLSATVTMAYEGAT